MTTNRSRKRIRKRKGRPPKASSQGVDKMNDVGVKNLSCESRRIIFYRKQEEKIKIYHENKIRTKNSCKIKDKVFRESWERSFLKEEPFESCQNADQGFYFIKSKDTRDTLKVMTQNVRKISKQLVGSNSLHNWNGDISAFNNKNINKQSTTNENLTKFFFINDKNILLSEENNTEEITKFDGLQKNRATVTMDSILQENGLKDQSHSAVSFKRKRESSSIADQKESFSLTACPVQSCTHNSLSVQKIEFAKQVSIKLTKQGLKDCELKFVHIPVLNYKNSNDTKVQDNSTNLSPVRNCQDIGANNSTERNCQSSCANISPARNCRNNSVYISPVRNSQRSCTNSSPARNCQSNTANISPARSNRRSNSVDISPVRNRRNNSANIFQSRNSQSNNADFSPIHSCQSSNVNFSPLRDDRSGRSSFSPDYNNNQNSNLYIFMPNTLGPRSVQYTTEIDKDLEEDDIPIKISLENRNSLLSKYPCCEMTLEYLELRCMYNKLKNRQLHWFCDCPPLLKQRESFCN